MPRNLIERIKDRFLFQFWALHSLNCIIEHLVTIVRAILSAGFMGIGEVWLSKIGVPLPLLVGVSVLGYGSALVVLGQAKVNEIRQAVGVGR